MNRGAQQAEGVRRLMLGPPGNEADQEAFKRFVESLAHGTEVTWETALEGGLTVHAYFPRSLIENVAENTRIRDHDRSGRDELAEYIAGLRARIAASERLLSAATHLQRLFTAQVSDAEIRRASAFMERCARELEAEVNERCEATT